MHLVGFIIRRLLPVAFDRSQSENDRTHSIYVSGANNVSCSHLLIRMMMKMVISKSLDWIPGHAEGLRQCETLALRIWWDPGFSRPGDRIFLSPPWPSSVLPREIR